MFNVSNILAGAMLELVGFLLPFIIVALIVSFIVRAINGKNTSYGRVKPGEVLMDGVKPERSNSTAMNILLYIGSFLIVGSMMLFIQDTPEVMPVVLIIATILIYSAGLLIYRFVDYLTPVSIAFTYSAMILFPLWYYAFTECNIPSNVALFVSTLISFCAYVGATFVVESRIAGWLSYIWLILVGWTGANLIGEQALTYSFFIWPSLVAFLPNLCWSLRVKWLPVPFRKATRVLADLLTPVFAVFAILCLSVENIGQDYPALRTIVAALAVGNGLISWITSKKRIYLLALRFYIQAFIILLVADILNYSFIKEAMFTGGVNIGTELTMAIVWLVSFLGQTICSLFIPQRNEDDKRLEHGVLIASLVGVFSTTLFCAYFDQVPRAILMIAIAVVTAILGILIAMRYRNITWCIATVIGVMAIPSIIGTDLATPRWTGWIYFAIYSVLTLAFIGTYALLNARNVQPKQSLELAIAAVSLGGLCCVISGGMEQYASAGFFVTAFFVALISIISQSYKFLEASVYLASLALFDVVGKAYDTRDYGYSYNTDYVLPAIRAHIISLPILGFGIAKERKDLAGARTVLGYIAFTLPMAIIALGANHGSQMTAIPILFILEEAAFIAFGAFTGRKWMAIAAAVIVVLTTLDLTGGLNSIWLMLIGIGLICVVGWQLAKNNKK